MTVRPNIGLAAIYTATIALLLSLAACNGLYLGDNPQPNTRKETGPLTVPPRAVRDGTAR